MERYFKPKPEHQIDLGVKNGTDSNAVVASTSDVIDIYNEEHSDSDNDETNENSKSAKVKYRVPRKCSDKWLNQFNWLITTETKESYCKVCHHIINGGITHVRRHSLTLKHKVKLKAAMNTPSIKNMLKSSEENNMNELIKKSEILSIMFIAEHNLPFLLLDHLGKLFREICPDSKIAKKINIHRKKGTYLCTSVIANYQKTSLVHEISNCFFSIIIDETTDVSSSKCLVMVVRYYKNFKIMERFLGLLKLESASASSIFKVILSFFKKNGLSTNKMIGFAADNASVMMGEKTALKFLFKNIIPHIFILGCVCHSFSLCSSASCQKLPKCVELLARDICNYFSHSSVRLGDLKVCQVFLNLKPHKMLKLAQTKWLSLQAVVDRILEQFDALIMFFTNEAFNRANDKISKPDAILEALKNPVFKLYFLFLSYILQLVNKLNVEFQSANVRLPFLADQVNDLYRTILKNFIAPKKIVEDTGKIEINNPDHYLPIDKIHYGAKAEMYLLETIDKISQSDLESFRVHCLSFYVEMSNQIKKRFSFQDPVLKFVKILDPKYLFSGEIESLVPIIKRFPLLSDDIEALNIEWRLLQENTYIKKLMSSHKVLEFWNEVFSLKNDLDETMFPLLEKCISGLLCLPHSSAGAERFFSQLNLIKNKNRNRLLVNTCDALLHTKDLLNESNCFQFKIPTTLLEKKINYKLSTNEQEDDVPSQSQ